MSGTDIGTIAKMADAIINLISTFTPTSGIPVTIDDISDLSSRLAAFINTGIITDKLASLYFNDSNLTSYIDIKVKNTRAAGYGSMLSIDELD